MTNKDFANLVDFYISQSGVTKQFIADKLQVKRQQIDNLLKKRNFSIEDANKLLSPIGYEVDLVSIKKIEKNQ